MDYAFRLMLDDEIYARYDVIFEELVKLEIKWSFGSLVFKWNLYQSSCIPGTIGLIFLTMFLIVGNEQGGGMLAGAHCIQLW